jgi:DNA recombination protein RmuC
MGILLGLAIGLLLSGIGVWIIMRSQIQGATTQLRTNEEKIEIYLSQRNTQIQENQNNRELQSETTELKEELARLTTRLAEEQKSTHEKLDLLKNTQQNLTDTFKALSSDALQKNNQQFLVLHFSKILR